jgi:hypothetical protein
MRLLRGATALALLWLALWIEGRANGILDRLDAHRSARETRTRPSGPLMPRRAG